MSTARRHRPTAPRGLLLLGAFGLLMACGSDGGGGDPSDTTSNSGNALPCSFSKNLTCDRDSAQCVEITWSGAGGPCGTATRACRADFTCAPGTSTCVAAPTAGQPCAQGVCASDSYCDFDTTTCIELKAAGAACSAPFECADGLACVGGICGALQWEACSAPGPAVTGSDAFDPAAVASQLGAAACAYRARCRPVVAAGGASAAVCESDYVMANQHVLEAIGAAITASRIGFRQSALTACLEEYADVDCDLGLTHNGPCDKWLYGAGTAGAGCFFEAECADGFFCGADGGGSTRCGACAPRQPDVGDDCSAAACAEELDCVDVNTPDGVDSVCVPVAGLDAACGTLETGLCAGELLCVGDPASPVCTRPGGAVGAACD